MSQNPRHPWQAFLAAALRRYLGSAVMVAVVAGVQVWGISAYSTATPAAAQPAEQSRHAYLMQHLASGSGPSETEEDMAATRRIQDAYTYAIRNPNVLKYLPCYCGCGRTIGHRSNLDCFVRDIRGDGAVLFDRHAVGCQLCVDIALEAQRLQGEGQTPMQIRQAIEQAYAERGPGTETAWPPSSG